MAGTGPLSRRAGSGEQRAFTGKLSLPLLQAAKFKQEAPIQTAIVFFHENTTTAKDCRFRYSAKPRGRFHRLPFGPALRFGDARTVPMAPLIANFRCSDN